MEGAKAAKNITITGGGHDFAEYVTHLVEMAVMLLDSPVASARTEQVGDHRFCFVKAENGKCVNLVYAPGAKYSLLFNREKQVPVASGLFKELMAAILKFFDGGKAPFDGAQTLEAIRLRDMLLK